MTLYESLGTLSNVYRTARHGRTTQIWVLVIFRNVYAFFHAIMLACPLVHWMRQPTLYLTLGKFFCMGGWCKVLSIVAGLHICYIQELKRDLTEYLKLQYDLWQQYDLYNKYYGWNSHFQYIVYSSKNWGKYNESYLLKYFRQKRRTRSHKIEFSNRENMITSHTL